MSLHLDPWKFYMHWEKLQLETVAQLQRLCSQEFFLLHKRPLLIDLRRILTRKGVFLEPCWPDVFAFFGKTMEEACLKMESMRNILVKVGNSAFGVCVDVKLPNGTAGWISQSYSSNSWDEKGASTRVYSMVTKKELGLL